MLGSLTGCQQARLGGPPAAARYSLQRTYVEGQAVAPWTGTGISDELFLEFKDGAFSRVLSGSLDVCFLFLLRGGSLLFPGALRNSRWVCFPPLSREPEIPPSGPRSRARGPLEAATSSVGSSGVLHSDLIPQSTGALLIAPRLSCFHPDGQWKPQR